MRKSTSSNFTNETELAAICPMHNVMRVLGGRWKIALLYFIHQDHNRFSLLQKKLPFITTKMLSTQLKELEQDNLVKRKVYAEVPPRVEYSLTAKGKSLLPVLEDLYIWGEKHAKTKTPFRTVS
jgi:DNA-binding HxlR family transcriptional regulator